MYTILWQELRGNDYVDRWERLETKEGVRKLLEDLKDNPDVCEYDVLIFLPDADDSTMDCEDFMAYSG